MNDYFYLALRELSGICLFFYAIEKFSNAILSDRIEEIKDFFVRISDTKPKGVLSGFVSAIFLQSSTAISSLAVALINAKILNISSAIPIMFGAMIGSSSTALLVSFKIKIIDQILIITGSILFFTKRKKIAKIMFYLGVVLFSIEQVSVATNSLRDTRIFLYLFNNFSDALVLYFIGIILTIILQSSGLIGGILVILLNQHAINTQNAVLIAIGSISGTTLTAFIVSFKMSYEARLAAILNIGISFLTGLILLPFADCFNKFIFSFKDPGSGFAICNILIRMLAGAISLVIFYIIEKRVNFLVVQNKTK